MHSIRRAREDDTELPRLSIEIRPLNTECSSGVGQPPAVMLEHRRDVFALEAEPSLPKISGRHKRRRGPIELELPQQVLDLNDFAALASYGSFDHASQFGQIAGPGQGRQQRERGLGKTATAKSCLAHVFKDSGRKRRHVLGAIPKRRQIDAAGREPPEQVRAKMSRIGIRIDPGSGARNEPTGYRDSLAVQGGFTVANDARQPSLEGCRQLANVLQEHRTAWCGGQSTIRPYLFEICGRASRTGTEQQRVDVLTLAINRDERRARAAAALMHFTSNRFNISTLLRHEQHAPIAGARLSDQFVDPMDGGRAAGQLQSAPWRPDSGRPTARECCSVRHDLGNKET